MVCIHSSIMFDPGTVCFVQSNLVVPDSVVLRSCCTEIPPDHRVSPTSPASPVPFTTVSSQIPIARHWCIINPLQILPFDQTLDLLLDHGHVRFEPAHELVDRLIDELGVRRLLPLPVTFVRILINSAGQELRLTSWFAQWQPRPQSRGCHCSSSRSPYAPYHSRRGC